MLGRDDLYRDPDLSLSRLSRRLGVTARLVSEAVNRAAGKNFSQYVNEHRVRAACELLERTDAPVTQVMLEAGFVTKSNFNREFRRTTGESPSAWRARHRPDAPDI